MTVEGPERHDDVDTEGDELPRGRVLVTVAAVVVIGLALGAAAWLFLHLREESLRPGRVFPERALPPPRERWGVRQELFAAPDVQDRTVAADRERLGRYTWVDRERRIVGLPIDRAIDLYLARRGRGRAP